MSHLFLLCSWWPWVQDNSNRYRTSDDARKGQIKRFLKGFWIYSSVTAGLISSTMNAWSWNKKQGLSKTWQTINLGAVLKVLKCGPWVIMVRLWILRLEGGIDKQDRHRSQINPSTVHFMIYVCMCTRERTSIRVCLCLTERQREREFSHLWMCAATL